MSQTPEGVSAAAGVQRVSLVVPMRNEAEQAERFVADIAAQDVDAEIELLVADGASDDDSVERLKRAAERAGIRLVALENSARWVSHGLNTCIERASGDLIVRLDCHSRYPSDYLRRCVVASQETGAWNVGGVVVPEGRTSWERAVACAMDSPFGGIGWTRHAFSVDRVEVDTVTYGAFRPEVFRRVGLFDETLLRNQDDEFNLRLRRAGGRIVLDPSIRVGYTPRSSLVGVFRQYYEYGLWKVPVMLKHRRALSVRSLIPAAFVASLAMLAPASVGRRLPRRILSGELASYAAAALLFGAASVRRRNEPWTLLPRVVAVFPAFHLAFGLGMLTGWLRALGAPKRPPIQRGAARDRSTRDPQP
jgi:glycosyltransferase involved in cell wall biosynthesis